MPKRFTIHFTGGSMDGQTVKQEQLGVCFKRPVRPKSGLMYYEIYAWDELDMETREVSASLGATEPFTAVEPME